MAIDEAEAIRAARLAQNRAMAAGDLDVVATFWTPDITIRRALGHAVSGIDEARRVLEPACAGPGRLGYWRSTTSVEVSPHWPLAYEEGQWHGYLDDVSRQVMAGRYSAQWVKRDGKWLIRAELFVALTCADAGCAAVALP